MNKVISLIKSLIRLHKLLPNLKLDKDEIFIKVEDLIVLLQELIPAYVSEDDARKVRSGLYSYCPVVQIDSQNKISFVGFKITPTLTPVAKKEP